MKPSARQIFSVVAAQSGLRPEVVLSRRMARRISRVRGRAFWAIRTIRPDMSFPRIGRIVDRDHTTILSAFRVCERRRQESEEERLACDAVLAVFFNESPEAMAS
jgi:chromosomal replication initiation ATPase DnaA